MVLGSWWRIVIILFWLQLILQDTSAQSDISILWDRDKAVGIWVPTSIIDHYQYPGSDQFFSVHLAGQTEAVIGTCKAFADRIEFKPYWPFTRGMKYEIKWKGQPIASVHIPEPNLAEKPLLRIYPSCDTVPANLLKVYLQFSKPMMQENIYPYITVLKNGVDTVDVFLPLQPPLWNDDQTRLTLWLDPGRIKRDLTPNRVLGKPLEEGNHYAIIVSSAWRDKSGVAMQQSVIKNYFVSVDDRKRPEPAGWRISSPVSGTLNPVTIRLSETLDYSLLQDAVFLKRDDTLVKGRVVLDDCEKVWMFVPETAWVEGKYTCVVERRIEDLAGNNLNRLFDEDIHSNNKSSEKERSDHIFEFYINH